MFLSIQYKITRFIYLYIHVALISVDIYLPSVNQHVSVLPIEFLLYFLLIGKVSALFMLSLCDETATGSHGEAGGQEAP